MAMDTRFWHSRLGHGHIRRAHFRTVVEQRNGRHPLSLTANFGNATISAQIAQDYQYNSAGASADPILGIHVAGSAPFGNDGLFDIPLAGTMNYASTNLQAAPAAESVTGDMNGAFFGPHAEQVGGVLALDRAGGTVLVQDVFVGRQRR